MSAEGAEATGGKGELEDLLSVVLPASLGTPALACRMIAGFAVAARVQQAEAERDALRERVEALASEWEAAREPDGSTAFAPVVALALELRAALDGTRGAA